MLGAWGTAPYFHNGSASTLEDVLDSRHGGERALTSAERNRLVAYLLSLDRPDPTLGVLTARIGGLPEAHDGSTAFPFTLDFSASVDMSFRDFFSDVFELTGATVEHVRRETHFRDARWIITLRPSGTAPVVIVLPAGRDCSEEGAVCTHAGQPLFKRVAASVPGPVSPPPAVVTVSAQSSPVTEGADAAFDVSLDSVHASELWVAIAVTQAGSVLRASGVPSVRFEIGETQKTLFLETDDDLVAETDGTVTVALSSGSNYTPGSPASASVTVTDNDGAAAVVISSAGSYSVQEGSTAVGTLTATSADNDAGDLVWSIPAADAGGEDGDKFVLTPAGALSFAVAKDYENPDDADTDGVYEVTVAVSDGTHATTQDLRVTVTDVAPGLTGPAAASHPEGKRGLRAAAFLADDGGDWSLAGTDSSLFTIADGYLRFVDPPDYEAGGDHTYNVTVRLSDGTATETIKVAVNVTDVDERGVVQVSTTQPRLGQELQAQLTDPDGISGAAAWQWERADGREGWDAINGATAARYTPAAADADRHLRVTATYTDRFGAGKQVWAIVPNIVIARRLRSLSVLGLQGVSGDGRAFYPPFDADTLHYAARCAESIRMSLEPEEDDVRLSVNGVQRPRGEAFTVGGLNGHSDITIQLSGSDGASTTYTVNCLQRADFPSLVTVKNEGASEDLMVFKIHLQPTSGGSRSFLIPDGQQRRAPLAPADCRQGHVVFPGLSERDPPPRPLCLRKGRHEPQPGRRRAGVARQVLQRGTGRRPHSQSVPVHKRPRSHGATEW